MSAFTALCERIYDKQFPSYEELHTWSVQKPIEFWSVLADFVGLKFSSPPENVFQQPGDMRSSRWFVGARLNFAENLLDQADDGIALVFCDEQGRRTELRRQELVTHVAELAAGLRRHGIQPGDRVAAVLPNCPEAIIIMLAAASVGAVFTSCSPDFGVRATLARFQQVEPRLLFCCDGYSYAGKQISYIAAARELADELPSVEQLIIVPFALEAYSEPQQSCELANFFIEGAAPQYEQLPFDHPLYILYSSGTTGTPKCILHGAGGTLLQHKKELMLHTDLHAGERIFFFTTCGWMMWNWLVSALAVKATVVLYDGSPFHPQADVLLQLARAERVNVFGTSPRYLTALEKQQNIEMPELPELRTVLSTGAPLAPESFDFVAAALGAEVQLCSISGGTDLIACFALGNPLLPVYRGELQCRALGMAVNVYDPLGQPVVAGSGELVCEQAFPSMPLGFWGDSDGSRYSAAYFERFPNIWTHGDYADLTERGGVIIRGRSDAVLNPGGVRIGSAEVCEPAMLIDVVQDCMAVGWCPDADEQIVLFVVLAADTALDPELIEKIKASIRSGASPRHVPAEVLAVPEIPRTLSGKAVELAVKAIIHGQPVDNLEAIANPSALEYFRDRL